MGPFVTISGQDEPRLPENLPKYLADFFRAWKPEQPADIESFLPKGAEAEAGLIRLIRADLALRIKYGLPVRVDDYLRNFYGLKDAEAALRRREQELLRQRALGGAIDPTQDVLSLPPTPEVSAAPFQPSSAPFLALTPPEPTHDATGSAPPFEASASPGPLSTPEIGLPPDLKPEPGSAPPFQPSMPAAAAGRPPGMATPLDFLPSKPHVASAPVPPASGPVHTPSGGAPAGGTGKSSTPHLASHPAGPAAPAAHTPINTPAGPFGRTPQAISGGGNHPLTDHGLHPPTDFGDSLQLPGYKILKELGEGGMGKVYLAKQTKINRIVALKRILGQAALHPEAVKRFRLEAEVVGRLDHPNIVKIYDFGEYQGAPYFALEYLAGGTLADRLLDKDAPKGLERRPLEPKQAAKLMWKLADAMSTAHRNGIIHRDLKPLNVLMANRLDQTDWLQWEPKITDFGLAKETSTNSQMTQGQLVFGTPSYMSPEQSIDTSKADGRTDIWALGVMLYEMLTGRLPFAGVNTQETLDKVRNIEPVSPRKARAAVVRDRRAAGLDRDKSHPSLPRDLETICLKCLEKDPHKRYATAGDLAEDLANYLADRPILARRAGMVERGWKWAQRNRGLARLAAAAVLLGLVTLAAVAVVVNQKQAEWAAAEKREKLQWERITGEEGAKHHLGQARAAVGKGNHPLARSELQKAYLSPPDDGDASEDLGREREAVNTQVIHLQERLNAFEELDQKRQTAQYQLMLATELNRLDQLKEARTTIQTGLMLFKADPDRGDRGSLPPREDFWSDEDWQTIMSRCFELVLLQAAIEEAEKGEAGYPQAHRLAEYADQLQHDTAAVQLARLRYQKGAGTNLASRLTPKDKEATDAFLVGQQAFRDADYASAARLFQKALMSQSDHFWAQYYLALCQIRQGDPREASGFLNSCIARAEKEQEGGGQKGANPFRVWLHLLRGYSALDARDYATAEKDLGPDGKAAECLAQVPDREAAFSVLLTRAILYTNLNRHGEALKELEKALDIATTDKKPEKAMVVHNNRAKLFLEQGNLAQAKASFAAALAALEAFAATPEGSKDKAGAELNRQKIHYEWGLVFRQEKEFAKALEAFQEVIRHAAVGGHRAGESQDLVAQAHLLRGRIYAAQKPPLLPEAIQELNATLRLRPRLFLSTYLFLADAHYQLALAPQAAEETRKEQLTTVLHVLERMTAAGGLPSLETSLLRGSAHMGLANLDVLKAERKRKDDRQRQTPGGSAAQGQPAPTAPPGLEHFNEAVVAFTEALEAERAQRQRLAGRLDLQRQVAVMAFWPMGGVGLNGTAGQWLDAIQVQRPCPEVWENHRTEAQLLLQRGLAHVSARAWGPADADLADALKNFPKEEAREQEPTILSYRAIAQVMLDQPREAVHLADRLTRGPQAATLTPDHLLTAARTYAIAATKTQVRKETDRIWERWGDDWRRAAMRNLELVVDRLPAAERKRFWDEKIRFDSSLDGLRADPQMEVQFRNLERRAAPGQVSAR